MILFRNLIFSAASDFSKKILPAFQWIDELLSICFKLKF